MGVVEWSNQKITTLFESFEIPKKKYLFIIVFFLDAAWNFDVFKYAIDEYYKRKGKVKIEECEEEEKK